MTHALTLDVFHLIAAFASIVNGLVTPVLVATVFITYAWIGLKLAAGLLAPQYGIAFRPGEVLVSLLSLPLVPYVNLPMQWFAQVEGASHPLVASFVRRHPAGTPLPTGSVELALAEYALVSLANAAALMVLVALLCYFVRDGVARIQRLQCREVIAT